MGCGNQISLRMKEQVRNSPSRSHVIARLGGWGMGWEGHLCHPSTVLPEGVSPTVKSNFLVVPILVMGHII